MYMLNVCKYNQCIQKCYQLYIVKIFILERISTQLFVINSTKSTFIIICNKFLKKLMNVNSIYNLILIGLKEFINQCVNMHLPPCYNINDNQEAGIIKSKKGFFACSFLLPFLVQKPVTSGSNLPHQRRACAQVAQKSLPKSQQVPPADR